MGLDLKNLPTKSVTAPKSVNISSLLAGVNEAEVFEKGSYFDAPGTYDVAVGKIISKTSGKTRKPLYIIEFNIEKTVAGAELQAGETKTMAQDLTNTNVALSVLKQFAMACLNPSREEKAEAEQKVQAVLEAGAGDEQVLKGTKLRLEVRPHTTTKGQQIHIVNFKPGVSE